MTEMLDVLGVAGHWMLAVAAVVAVVALVLPIPRLVRVRRRSRAVRVRLADAETRIEAAVAELRVRRAETERLLAPWRTAFKWAKHPLTIALIRSYRGRWRRWRAA